ncbi:unnamed protein product [Calypogeia fissa]
MVEDLIEDRSGAFAQSNVEKLQPGCGLVEVKKEARENRMNSKIQWYLNHKRALPLIPAKLSEPSSGSSSNSKEDKLIGSPTEESNLDEDSCGKSKRARGARKEHILEPKLVPKPKPMVVPRPKAPPKPRKKMVDLYLPPDDTSPDPSGLVSAKGSAPGEATDESLKALVALPHFFKGLDKEVLSHLSRAHYQQYILQCQLDHLNKELAEEHAN